MQPDKNKALPPTHAGQIAAGNLQANGESPSRCGDISERFNKLAGRGWQGALAHALSIRPATVSDAIKRGAPAYMVAALEFLEATKPGKWPDRWAKMRTLAEKDRSR